MNVAVKNAETGKGSIDFGYYVDIPKRFSIFEFDQYGKAIFIEEKHTKQKDYFEKDLYFYDNRAGKYVRNLKLSALGELEITDLNHRYLVDSTLNVELPGQGFT